MLAFAARWMSMVGVLSLTAIAVRADEPASPQLPSQVKRIDIVHLSHTDYGFTDHPEVCHELYRRYLDVALDAASATADQPAGTRFCWTAETTEPVRAWWAAAPPERRQAFLEVVKRGQIEVTALPLNNTPLLNAAQWRTMVDWLDEDLRAAVQPKVAIQDDVNGTPRAGAMLLLDRGVHYLFTGINEDSGGSPFPRPGAFWWKMPDGRRMLVWLNETYCPGFDLFEPGEWRRGPVPSASDGLYHPPGREEILKTDENSLRAAQQRCVKRVLGMEKRGYSAEVLVTSMTNQWRIDNDPPLVHLSEFVAAWNRLQLQPELRLVTVSTAMQDVEKALGDKAPEYAGEWPDWWANGAASSPREVAASRVAKRLLAAAQSPVCGAVDPRAQAVMDELYRELCLFDEHTWGSSNSVALPYELDALGQFNEKARLAYRPMAKARWLLSQRVRGQVLGRGEGLWVANPAAEAFCGWVNMPATCLREDYRSLQNVGSKEEIPLVRERGPQPFVRPPAPEALSPEDVSATFPDKAEGQMVRFWLEGLNAHSVQQFQLREEPAVEATPEDAPKPTVQVDDNGWPTSATWPGMTKPLFTAGVGDFTTVRAKAFAPRWVLRDVLDCRDEQRRAQMRKEQIEELTAVAAGKAAVVETPHTLVYTQSLKHPRLQWATRVLEIWKRQPRARLTFRLNRLASFDPEVFYVAFPLPCDGQLPRLTCGGKGYTPFEDQLPGTCRDYFATDDYAHYATEAGHWLWVTRDVPLVSIGGAQAYQRLSAPPARTGLLMSMAYNNCWYTNFVGDVPGVMEFQYDLAWRERMSEEYATQLSEAMTMDPVLVINPATATDPIYLKDLFRP